MFLETCKQDGNYRLVHDLLYNIFVCYFGMKKLFTFLTEKKNCFRPKKICLLNFHQQIIVISSQNNVQKCRTKGHEKVLFLFLR